MDYCGRLYQLVEELHGRGLTLEQARREFEKQFIVAALRSCSWNHSRSAKCLGIHRNTLRNKMSGLGIEADGSGATPLRRRAAR